MHKGMRPLRDLGLRPYIILGGFPQAGAPEEKMRLVAGQLVCMGFARIYSMHCSGENARNYLREKYSRPAGMEG
jgi:metal-dependent hydrolase (beta-lactamase superfamily II)